MAKQRKRRKSRAGKSRAFVWGALIIIVMLGGALAGIGYYNLQDNGGSTAGPSAPVSPPINTPEETVKSRSRANEPESPSVNEPTQIESREHINRPPEPELGARQPRGNGKIALTFDAGAAGDSVPDILATLDKYGVKCTFFLTGRWTEKYPDYARKIAAAGHELGNHTYTHKDLRTLSDEEIKRELERAEETVFRITGVSSKPYFRPPFGGRDKRVLTVAADSGYRSVYWTLDSFDSVKKGITAAQIRQRVVGRAKDGDIILCHCGSEATAEALPQILEQLTERFTLVTVSALEGAADTKG